MGRQGKIARLPMGIRDELNHRLADGQSARTILAWLNDLPRVKEILEEDFEGLRVSDQNLSDWRSGGFADWCKQRERIDRTKELARYAMEQSRANGASIADGASAIAAGKLLEAMEAIDETFDDEAGDGEKGKKPAAEKIAQIAYALSAIRTTEQNDVKLKLQKKALGQKERQLDLLQQKFQRDTCDLFLKWHEDQRAKDVLNGSGDNSEKIERLGQLMFGDTWKQAKPVPN